MAEPRSMEAPAKSDDDAPGPVDTHDAVAAPVDPAPADDDNVAEVLPRRHRRVVWTALAVGTVMALLIAVLATRPPALDNQARSPLLGHPAPGFAGVSVTDAGFTSLAALQGRWVVVNFFATWCVPCRQEHPEFIRFSQRHAATDDARLVMVIYSDKTTEVQKFFAANGGNWPAVPDPAGRVALDYGVAGVPETYLVSPQGVVVAKMVGGITADGLDRILAEAKAGASAGVAR